MYDKGLFAKLSSSPILAQAHLDWAEIRCIISKYSSALICNLFFLTIFRDVKKSYTAQQTARYWIGESMASSARKVIR